MSLTNCPECGHEVSIEAVACPNCGRPLSAPTPVIQRKVVVAERPTDEGFTKWVIVPIVILALVVVFLLIAITRNNEENANTRTVNVNMATQRSSTDSRDTRTVNPPNQVETSDIDARRAGHRPGDRRQSKRGVTRAWAAP